MKVRPPRKYYYKMFFSPYQTGLMATSIKDAKKKILAKYPDSDSRQIQYIVKA